MKHGNQTLGCSAALSLTLRAVAGSLRGWDEGRQPQPGRVKGRDLMSVA